MVADEDANQRLEPALGRLIGILLVGLVAVLLDTTVVNVATARLTRDLHTSVSAVQWVSTGFLLALGVAIPLTAWAVRRFGARRVWLLGVALFSVGSVLARCAWNAGSLIAFRVLQGLGGGLMLPVQQTLLVQAAGQARLGRVMGAYQGLQGEQVPHASSATRILLQVGGSFGVAVAAVVLQQELAAHPGAAAAQAIGFDGAFWWMIGLTAIALIPAALLPGGRRHEVSAASPSPAVVRE